MNSGHLGGAVPSGVVKQAMAQKCTPQLDLLQVVLICFAYPNGCLCLSHTTFVEG